MINLQRIRPTRTTLATVVGLLWAFLFGAVRDFVWADLREGLIDLHGLSRVTRGLVWLGFALLFLMVGALLFNDLWRALSPLLPQLNGMPGRGSLVPVALVPATLFLLAVAWGFVLTGALHSRPLIRLGVLLLYLLAAAAWINVDSGVALLMSGGALDLSAEMRRFGLHWGVAALVPLFFILRWRREARPGLEFPVLMLSVSAMLLLAQTREMENESVLGMSTLVPLLQTHIITLRGLIFPLLLLIGVDIAAFTWQAASWTREVISERLPHWVPFPLLALLLGWRLRDVTVQALGRIGETSLNAELLQYAGALGILLAAGLVWWIVTRLSASRSDESDEAASIEGVAESAERWAPPLVLVFSALQLIGNVLAMAAIAMPFGGPARGLVTQISGVIDLLNNRLTTPWHLLVNVAAVIGAVWLARRGRRGPALYLGIFGMIHLWFELSNPGRPLAFLTWRGPEPEDFWWTILLALVVLFWLLRRRLTAERAGRLLFLVLVTALLRQTDFIENPFSPFFGFAGIGFIAFGIVWDSLTIGSWANESTPGLPRIGRIFLYVGYVLLTVTVINWALTSHDLTTVGYFTGTSALVGLDRFGKPMLYAIFFVTLALPPNDNGEAGDTNGEAQPVTT